MTYSRVFAVAFLCVFVSMATKVDGQLPQDQPQGPALPPDEAKATFSIPSDLTWTQLLHEPEMSQPLMTRFDSAGRLWVVQYLQYPEPAGLKILSRDNFWRIVYDRMPKPPGQDVQGADKISIYEDKDADGHYELRNHFVEGLNIATSVVPTHEGAWVLNPPYLLFYRDENRDLRADGPPEVHLEGFGMEDTHSVANSLCLGPDGWLYAAQGSTVSGAIRPYGSAEPPLRSMGQHIWRYHPKLRRFEIFAEGGGNAFGVAFDDEGQVYSGHNGGDTRGFHYMQGGYYRKGFSKHGDLSNPFTFGYILPMSHDPVQRFTHTMLMLNGTSLEANRSNSMLAVDPLHGTLVQTQMQPIGSTFKTKDVETTVKTTDKWFRPVAISDGPDGAAYVCDWYDSQVAHIYAHVGRYDRDHGRIYRLAPKDSSNAPAVWNPNLSTAQDTKSLDELISRLDHPYRWQRWQSRQLIAAHPLRKQARSRLQAMAMSDTKHALDALWTLHACGWLGDCIESSDTDGIDPITFMQHPSRDVRAWVVRLVCDDFEVTDSVFEGISAMAQTEVDPRVLTQLACSARRLPADKALKLTNQLIHRPIDTADLFIPLYIWWSIERHATAFEQIDKLLVHDDSLYQIELYRNVIVPNLVQRWCMDGKAASFQAAQRLLTKIGSLPDDLKNQMTKPASDGFEKAFAGKSLVGVPDSLLDSLSRLGQPSLALKLRRGDEQAGKDAAAAIVDSNTPAAVRIQLATILREIPNPSVLDSLIQVSVDGKQNENLRCTTIAALQAYDSPDVADWLIGNWSEMSSKVKAVTAATLASRLSRAKKLLDAIEQKKIDAAQVPIEAVRNMRLHSDADFLNRIDQHFPPAVGLDLASGQKRAAVLSEIIRQSNGNPYPGKKIFMETCGRCHRLFDGGGPIGPDLTGYQRDMLQVLLLNVVAPNLEIREGYQSYAVLTNDSQLITGFVESQNDEQIVLRAVDGQSHIISRSEIDEMKPQAQSLMPEGLLDKLTEQQLSDLFAYLRSSQPLDDGT
jgi:putative heme-binding domain-containing protein